MRRGIPSGICNMNNSTNEHMKGCDIMAETKISSEKTDPYEGIPRHFLEINIIARITVHASDIKAI
jgi:hypothetical protein